jgi:hypothetical protein
MCQPHHCSEKRLFWSYSGNLVPNYIAQVPLLVLMSPICCELVSAAYSISLEQRSAGILCYCKKSTLPLQCIRDDSGTGDSSTSSQIPWILLPLNTPNSHLDITKRQCAWNGLPKAQPYHFLQSATTGMSALACSRSLVYCYVDWVASLKGLVCVLLISVLILSESILRYTANDIVHVKPAFGASSLIC